MIWFKYLIAGDENCQCVHWKDCRWSKLAVFSVMNLTKEKKEFKEVQRILRKHTCGDDPKDHFVNCCGPDQKPNEIDDSNDGKGFYVDFAHPARSCDKLKICVSLY